MQRYKEGAGLVATIEQEREFEKEQERLREKHQIEAEDVVIVERPSLVKFLLKLGISTCKTANRASFAGAFGTSGASLSAAAGRAAAGSGNHAAGSKRIYRHELT